MPANPPGASDPQGRWGSLTAQVADDTSPLSRYLAEHLPALAVMAGPLTAALRSARPTLRPPGLNPTPLDRTYWADAGAAVDYRLRLSLTPDIGPAPERGASLLAHRVEPGLWGILATGDVDRHAVALVEQARAHDPAVALPHPDPHLEDQLCRLAWWLGQFDRVYRTGKRPPRPDGSARASAAALFAAVPDHAVTDLRRMAGYAGVHGSHFHRLRAWAAGRPVIAGPEFTGSPDVGAAEADLIVGGLLLDIKATTTPATSGPTATAWWRQLAGYLLLDYHDAHGITHLGVYLPRQGIGATWPVPRVLSLAAGLERPRGLPEHRRLLFDALRARPSAQQ